MERIEREISGLYCTAASRPQLGKTLVEARNSASDKRWVSGSPPGVPSACGVTSWSRSR
jgi:hypothetical protein